MSRDRHVRDDGLAARQCGTKRAWRSGMAPPNETMMGMRRREFLVGSGLALGAGAIASCAEAGTKPPDGPAAARAAVRGSMSWAEVKDEFALAPSWRTCRASSSRRIRASCATPSMSTGAASTPTRSRTSSATSLGSSRRSETPPPSTPASAPMSSRHRGWGIPSGWPPRGTPRPSGEDQHVFEFVKGRAAR